MKIRNKPTRTKIKTKSIKIKNKPKAKLPKATKVKPAKPKTIKKTGLSEGLIPVRIKKHFDNKGGHPHVILSNIDDKHISVGLSTKPTKGKGSKNYLLDNDPLGSGKKSYMRRQGTVAPMKEYNNPCRGEMTPKNYAQAQEYGEKAKQKYIEKKDKKK